MWQIAVRMNVRMDVRGAGLGLGLLVACGPSPSSSVAPPPASPPTPAEPVASPAPPARYVVVSSGAPLFESADATSPRGVLGTLGDVGGWTARVVDRRPGFVAIQAELDPTREHCAAPLAGLDGLGLTLWVPREHLATVIVQEVELLADECPQLRARPGVMVDALCQEDGSVRYSVGSCPNARCWYDVPKEAMGLEYEPSPLPSPPPPDEPRDSRYDRFTKFIPMPCIDVVEEDGVTRPHVLHASRFGAGMPAISLASSVTRDLEPGEMPECRMSYTAGQCDQRPKLGFDHVSYVLERGTPLRWSDGTAAGSSRGEHRFRSVPRETEDGLCWSAVEGEARADHLELCAPAGAVSREQQAHVEILQTRSNGKRTGSWHGKDAMTCYAEALGTTPGLQGRVRARYRIEGDAATFEGLEAAAPPGAESFARCLAPHLADPQDEPHTLEVVMDLHPPSPKAAGLESTPQP